MRGTSGRYLSSLSIGSFANVTGQLIRGIHSICVVHLLSLFHFYFINRHNLVNGELIVKSGLVDKRKVMGGAFC